MKVLMVEPGKVPYETEIDGGYESLKKAIDCDVIQGVYPFEEPVGLVCDDEGKLNGKPLNRSLTDEDGNVYDIVAGKFLFTINVGFSGYFPKTIKN